MLTKKCNFRLGKDSYMSLKLSWAGARHSLYTESLNHGYVPILTIWHSLLFLLSLMRMREFGLITYWKRAYEADASRCIYKAKEHAGIERLNVHHLTGAFAVLIIGSLVSLVVFLCENRTRILTCKR